MGQPFDFAAAAAGVRGDADSGLNRLRKRSEHWAKSTISISAGAKARLILLRLLARLKSCPFYKALLCWVFSQPVKAVALRHCSVENHP